MCYLDMLWLIELNNCFEKSLSIKYNKYNNVLYRGKKKKRKIIKINENKKKESNEFNNGV